MSEDEAFESVRTLKPRLVVTDAGSTAYHRPDVSGYWKQKPTKQLPMRRAVRPVKSVEQQDILAPHRMRAILLRNRTALINHAARR